MKKHLKRKQSELLHNAPGVMAAEVADVKDSFHQGKQCSAHAQMQSSQIWINFSESRNLGISHSSCLLVVFLFV